MHLSTYNVRSLIEDWKKNGISIEAGKYNISMMVRQEHWIAYTKPIILNGYKFLLAPQKKNSVFLLSPWAQNCYIDHHIVSDNIMAVKFSGHLTTHIIKLPLPSHCLLRS